MATVVHKVLKGIDFPPNRRVEIGDEVSDLPSKSIKWLFEIGAIEAADGSKSDIFVDKTKDKITPSLDESPVQEPYSMDKTDDKTDDIVEAE